MEWRLNEFRQCLELCPLTVSSAELLWDTRTPGLAPRALWVPLWTTEMHTVSSLAAKWVSEVVGLSVYLPSGQPGSASRASEREVGVTPSFCNGGAWRVPKVLSRSWYNFGWVFFPTCVPGCPLTPQLNLWAWGFMKSLLLNAAFLGSQIVWSSGNNGLGTCRQSGVIVSFWRSWRGVLCAPLPPGGGLLPLPVRPPHASFSRRPSVLQRLGHGLQGDGQHHQVGTPVPAVGPAATPQPPPDQRSLPRARRGARLLPQPRRADGGPLVLHAE